MPVFDYEALDAEGRPVKDRIEAESAHAVLELLREQGFYVSSVSPSGAFVRFSREGRSLKAEDLAFLSEQLHVLTQGGLPLAPALKELARDLHNPRLSPLVLDLQQDLENGRTLEESLDRHQESFPEVFLCLVRAGERTGNLPGVFAQLAMYSRRLVSLKSHVQQALAYPFFVILFLGIVMALLVTVVVPQFQSVYASFGGTLPLSTRIVLYASYALRIALIPGLVVFFFLCFGAWAAGPALRGNRRLDTLKLHAPVFGGMYRAALTARFTRVLGMLLANGAVAVEGIQLAALATGSPVFRNTCARAARRVANGETLADALEETGLFRHSTCWVLRHGEDNGMLDEALLRLAEASEREVARLDRQVLLFLSPVLTILVGTLVGFMVVALFMPILKLSSLVS